MINEDELLTQKRRLEEELRSLELFHELSLTKDPDREVFTGVIREESEYGHQDSCHYELEIPFEIEVPASIQHVDPASPEEGELAVSCKAYLFDGENEKEVKHVLENILPETLENYRNALIAALRAGALEIWERMVKWFPDQQTLERMAKEYQEDQSATRGFHISQLIWHLSKAYNVPVQITPIDVPLGAFLEENARSRFCHLGKELASASWINNVANVNLLVTDGLLETAEVRLGCITAGADAFNIYYHAAMDLNQLVPAFTKSYLQYLHHLITEVEEALTEEVEVTLPVTLTYRVPRDGKKDMETLGQFLLGIPLWVENTLQGKPAGNQPVKAVVGKPVTA
jgi:hypothetical protein